VSARVALAVSGSLRYAEQPACLDTGRAAWRSSAFGLALEGAFEAPGFARDLHAASDFPLVRLNLMSDPDVRAAWVDDQAERLVNWRFDDGRPVMTVDRHPELGYRLFAIGQGVHVVSADGSRICSAPAGAEDWIWQRFLVGQVLPLAAVLSGREVLHASAVTIVGRAVCFVGESGAGKTSLALNLALRGAEILSDDVAAVSLRGPHLTVHPGPRLANLRHEEDTRLGPRRALLGEAIGSDAEGLRLVVPGAPAPARLSAVYFLDRAADVDELQFLELSDKPFSALAACCFTRFLSTPDRLRNQLRTYGTLVDSARLFRLCVPAGMGAAELSVHVEAHACDELD